MSPRNFLVDEDGNIKEIKIARDWHLLEHPYYLYHFLHQVEAVVGDQTGDLDMLILLHQLVRKLILNSYWLTTQKPELNSSNISIRNLYDETGFPWTIQTVTFAPGVESSIHNHGTWGVIAILQGAEKNTFWQRNNHYQKITPTSEIILETGDIISFHPQAIHSVVSVGKENLVTFNLYGETNHQQRWEFDPVTNQAKNY